MNDVSFTEKSRVKGSFERAAAQYDEVAVLQREVSQRMASRLEYIKVQPTRIIDAGSGTGAGAAMLRKHYPNSMVIELDFAYAMLDQSRNKYMSTEGFLKRLLTRKILWQVCGDIEMLPLREASLDMVWSNLALQWVPIPDQVFAEFYRVLAPGGMLMFSTLGPDTLMELRQSFHGLDQAAHVNPFIDMHDLGDALLRHGFTEPVMDMEKIIMTYRDVRSVIRDLKAIGAHTVMNGQRRGLLGKEAWQRIEETYEKYRCNGTLPVTYEVVYGHAWKESHCTSHSVLPDGRHIIQFNPSQRGR